MALHASKPVEDKNSSPNVTGGKGTKDYTYKVETKADSQVEIEVTVKAERLLMAKEVVYKHLASTTQIAGFREGKAPRNLIEAKLGARLYEEAVNQIVPVITAEIMEEAKYEPLDYAQYGVKKISDTDGLVFTATFTVVPEVKLPDFKKLKAQIEEVKVEKKEVEELIASLKKELTAKKPNEHNHSHEGHDHSHEGHDHNHDHSHKEHDHADKKEQEATTTEADAEIDWAKELNQPDLKTEADVSAQLEKNLIERRTADAEDKFLTELVQEALELAKIESPKPLVDAQSLRKEAQYKQRIQNLGINLDDFLKAQNTDLETLRKSWKKEAEFQIGSDLLFINIAKQNEIKVAPEEVDAEVSKVDDPQLKADYSSASGRNYISSIILRQKALVKLRELAGKAPKESKKESKAA